MKSDEIRVQKTKLAVVFGVISLSGQLFDRMGAFAGY